MHGYLSRRTPREGLICHQITRNSTIRDWFSLSQKNHAFISFLMGRWEWMPVLIKRSAETRGKAMLDGWQQTIPSLSLALRLCEQDAPHRQHTLPRSWWHELCSLPLTLLCFVNVRVSQNEQICKSQVPSYVYWRESHHNPLRASPFLPFCHLHFCRRAQNNVG